MFPYVLATICMAVGVVAYIHFKGLHIEVEDFDCDATVALDPLGDNVKALSKAYRQVCTTSYIVLQTQTKNEDKVHEEEQSIHTEAATS